MSAEMVGVRDRSGGAFGWPIGLHSREPIILKVDQPTTGGAVSWAVGVFLAVISITGTSPTGARPTYSQTSDLTSQARVGLFARQEDVRPVPDVLTSIRSQTALTWDQLALIFQVSRRAVHLWAAGKTLSPENAAKVEDLAARIALLPGNRPLKLKSMILADYGIAVPNKTRSVDRGKLPILTADQSPVPQALRLSRSVAKTRRVQA